MNDVDVNADHMQGILWTSISYQYATFHIAINAEYETFAVTYYQFYNRVIVMYT